MNPTEKAKELFDKMNGFRITHAHRIKCAKIVCDEVISLEFDNIYTCKYWKEVKVELDKLKKK